MLSKLFKHEMKATSRLLLPMYLILAVLTVMERIVINLHFKGSLVIIPGFITFAYIISLLAIVIVSTVIVIIRFYRNLMTDEGYLMFTLPVKSHELINAKLIAAFIWNIGSLAAVIFSLMLAFLNSERMDILKEGLQIFYNELESQFGSQATLFLVEMIIMLVIGSVNSILMIYASIAVGQLINGHKVLGSFAAYIAINTAVQTGSMVCMGIASIIFKDTLNDISLISKVFFPVLIVTFIVLSIAYYITTNYIFRKKMNID